MIDLKKKRLIELGEFLNKSVFDGSLKTNDAFAEGIILFTQGSVALLKEHETIVRCKDCKHSCDYTDIFPDRAYKCIKNGGYHNDSWFCADGKGRDGDDV